MQEMVLRQSLVTRALAATAAVAVLGACAQSPSAQSPRPAATASPASAVTPSAAPKSAMGLFAVLTGGRWNDGPAVHDKVQILGLDGKVRASADFTPRTLPEVGAVPNLQDEARVAAGRVYYADGAGAIRTLAPDGTVAEVARLPFHGGQQELSFAVSPDGKVLEAAILTLPPASPKPRQSLADPVWGPGNASIDLYRVSGGRQPVNIFHRDWVPDFSQPWPSFQAVGYGQGVIYTMPTSLGTQQPYNGRRWFGPAVHFSAITRSASAPLGGSGCDPQADNGAGVFVCLDQHERNPSVRNGNGSLVWAFPAADENYSYFTFSPSGSRLAYFKFGQATPARAEVITIHGDAVAHLSTDFRPRAWLDEDTLLGDHILPQGTPRLAYIKLAAPNVMTDLGELPAFAVVGPLTSAGPVGAG